MLRFSKNKDKSEREILEEEIKLAHEACEHWRNNMLTHYSNAKKCNPNFGWNSLDLDDDSCMIIGDNLWRSDQKLQSLQSQLEALNQKDPQVEDKSRLK